MKIFTLILAGLIVVTGFLRLFLGIFPVSATSIESGSLMAKINAERINRNIPALFYSSKLGEASAAKTADMFARGYFDHVDPDGRYVWFRIEAAGYKPYRTLGENLAIDFSTEEGVIRAWINSPSHRDNLLNANFADQGLSAQYGNYQTRYTSVVTSLFGTLVGPSIAAASPNFPVSPPARLNPNPPAGASAQPPPAPPDGGNARTGQNVSEPAILLSAVPAFATATATQNFAMVIPSGLASFDIDAYSALRRVFIFLVFIFIVTFFIDSLRRRQVSRFFEKNAHLSILWAVLIACALSANLY